MLPRENARFADVLARFPRQLHLVLLVLTPRPPSSMLIINVAFQERRHLAALGTAALAHPRPVSVFHENDHIELPLAIVAPALDSILAVNLSFAFSRVSSTALLPSLSESDIAARTIGYATPDAEYTYTFTFLHKDSRTNVCYGMSGQIVRCANQ